MILLEDIVEVFALQHLDDPPCADEFQDYVQAL